MTPTDIERLQTYLRKLFGSERIKIVPPLRKGLSVELAINDETIGTIHQDTDEGETSYSIHITVLEEDLPARPRPVPAPAKRGPDAPRTPSRPLFGFPEYCWSG